MEMTDQLGEDMPQGCMRSWPVSSICELRLLLWKNLLLKFRNRLGCCLEVVGFIIFAILFLMLQAIIHLVKLDHVPDCPSERGFAQPSLGLIPNVLDRLCKTVDPNYDTCSTDGGPSINWANVFHKYDTETENETASHSHSMNSDLEQRMFDIPESQPDLRFRRWWNGMQKSFKASVNEEERSARKLAQRQWYSIQRDTWALCQRARNLTSSDYSTVSTPRIFNPNKSNRTNPHFSKQCNKMMEELHTTDNSLFTFLRDLRPLIFGEILYAPKNAWTEAVMERVSRDWDELADIIKDVHQLSEQLAKQKVPERERFSNDLQLKDIRRLMQYVRFGNPPFHQTVAHTKSKKFDSFISEEVRLLLSILSVCLPTKKIRGYPDTKTMVSHARSMITHDHLSTAITFVTPEYGGSAPPKFVEYVLHVAEDSTTPSHALFPLSTARRRQMSPSAKKIPHRGPESKSPPSIAKGFLAVQDQVERAIMEETLRSLNKSHEGILNVGLSVRTMPTPCMHSSVLEVLSSGAPMIIAFVWVLCFALLTQTMVLEKQQKLKEIMLIMGVGRFNYWFSWFITYYAFFFFYSLILSLFLVLVIFTRSEVMVLLLINAAYISTLISFAFFLSCFFSKPNTAFLVAIITYILILMPTAIISRRENTAGWWEKLICYLLSPPVTYCRAWMLVFGWEMIEGTGVDYGHMFTSIPLEGINPSYGLDTIGGELFILLSQAIVYLILTWYFEAVIPEESGYSLPFYFPLLPSYWCGEVVPNKAEGVQGRSPGGGGGKTLFQPPSKKEVPSVEIRNLRKVFGDVFGTGKVALEDVTVTFYKNQITALLGPNGAGKTVLISLLTGQLTPTSGTATVEGLGISFSMPEIRRITGICPQYNILWNELSVWEHLLFYETLKRGTLDTNGFREAGEMLKDMKLDHRRNNLVGELSGGMQRKLSIALAFAGNAKVVFLDEPSSGVDPFSRRSIWNLLNKYRRGRTLILTTHYMDEAQMLSDRVVIMNEGKVRTSATFSYLKQLLSDGYTFRVALQREANHARGKRRAGATENGVQEESLESEDSNDDSDTTETDIATFAANRQGSGEGTEDSKSMNPSQRNPHSKNQSTATLTAFIQKHYSTAFLREQIGSELTYLLPWSESKGAGLAEYGPPRPEVTRIQNLIDNLETHKDKLKVESYGLSDTQMEEIFLKVSTNPAFPDKSRPFGGKSKSQSSNDQKTLSNEHPVSKSRSLRKHSRKNSGGKERSTKSHNKKSHTKSHNKKSHTKSLNKKSSSKSKSTDKSARNRTRTKGGGETTQSPQEHNVRTTESQNSHEVTFDSGTDESGQDDENRYDANKPKEWKFRTKHIPYKTLSSIESLEEDLESSSKDDENFQTFDKLQNRQRSKSTRQRTGDEETDTPAHFNRHTGCTLRLMQFYAVHYKRYHNTKGNWISVLCQCALPLLFMILCLLPISLMPNMISGSDNSPFPLLLSHYPGQNVIFYAERGTAEERKWTKSFTRSPYLGPHCVKNKHASKEFMEFFQCRETASKALDARSPRTEDGISEAPECGCTSSGGYYCQEGKIDVPSKSLPTANDVLLNATTFLDRSTQTTQNLQSWLLAMWPSSNSKMRSGYTIAYPYNSNQDLNVEVRKLLKSFQEETTDPNANATLNKITNKWNSIYQKQLEPKKAAIEVWYDPFFYFAAPAAMTAINNALYREALRESRLTERSRVGVDVDVEEYGFSSNTQPLSGDEPKEKKPGKEHASEDILLGLTLAIIISIGIIFVPATYAAYLVSEKQTGSLHLQYSSGLPPWLFWTATYIWDMFCYVWSLLFVVVILAAFQQWTIVGERNIVAATLLLLGFGFSGIPFAYTIGTTCINNPAAAFGLVATVNLICAIALLLISSLGKQLQGLQKQNTEEESPLNDILDLESVYRLFPPYCLTKGLLKLMLPEEIISPNANQPHSEKSPLAWLQTGSYIFFIIVIDTILWLGLTLLIQYIKYWNMCNCKCFSIFSWSQNKKTSFESQVDEDVRREKELVKAGEYADSTLAVNGIRKTFNKGCCGLSSVTAVKEIYFGVNAGECFGLLGINGAGKTTCFKMITGEIQPTSGDAFIQKFSVTSQRSEVQDRLGYCPQTFDALDPYLTGRNLLIYYALIRGVPCSLQHDVVSYMIRRVNLEEFADRAAGTYSGGNKRKLNTAIALIGNPPLILLDEPTTGMDPRSRRFLWECILGMLRERRAVLLTSHSMEECDFLSSRIGIMIAGRMTCLGPPTYLKSKFGHGYIAIVSFQTKDGPQVKEYLENYISNIQLVEEQPTRVTYSIPPEKKGGPKLSRALKVLEQSRSQARVQDFSLTQSSLDEVFVRLAQANDKTQDKIPEEEGFLFGLAT